MAPLIKLRSGVPERLFQGDVFDEAFARFTGAPSGFLEPESFDQSSLKAAATISSTFVIESILALVFVLCLGPQPRRRARRHWRANSSAPMCFDRRARADANKLLSARFQNRPAARRTERLPRNRARSS